MYLAVVLLLMLVLPVGSAAVELILHAASGPAVLIVAGKWFVFWGVGGRLALAGIRQIARPGLTLEGILGVKGDEAFVIVRELGFANLAIGTVALCSIFAPAWVLPSALAGLIFYALAGIGHVRKHERNRDENIALISDLFMAAVLFVYIVGAVAMFGVPA